MIFVMSSPFSLLTNISNNYSTAMKYCQQHIVRNNKAACANRTDCLTYHFAFAVCLTGGILSDGLYFISVTEPFSTASSLPFS